MDWMQVLAIIGTTVGCCWFFRRETKEQMEKFDRRMEKYEQDNKEFKERWATESKEFHGRLLVLEEERNRILRSRSNLYL
jgi:hypothetical protein